MTPQHSQHRVNQQSATSKPARSLSESNGRQSSPNQASDTDPSAPELTSCPLNGSR